MSRLDEPTDPGSIAFSARLTVRAHDAGRRCCLDCPGDGCGQNAWARKTLAEPARAERATGSTR